MNRKFQKHFENIVNKVPPNDLFSEGKVCGFLQSFGNMGIEAWIFRIYITGPLTAKEKKSLKNYWNKVKAQGKTFLTGTMSYALFKISCKIIRIREG